MKFFLSSDLYGHRRGRFLASILNVEAWSEDLLPESGFVMVCGEAFQQAVDKQETYLSWARQPGCCLLLLPPFKVGSLIDGLDWSINFSSTPPIVSDANSLADVVAQEVMYQLNGSDGNSESCAGHYWNDHSPHTLIYAHISLCKDQPLYIIANSRKPLSIVMGPGGDSEAKPFQPPIRAMIQDAQASWFLWWGFFCFAVRPSY